MTNLTSPVGNITITLEEANAALMTIGRFKASPNFGKDWLATWFIAQNISSTELFRLRAIILENFANESFEIQKLEMLALVLGFLTQEYFKLDLSKRKPHMSDYKLISNMEYSMLENPKFIGQTRMDEDNMYYMMWESEGKLYKTHNKL